MRVLKGQNESWDLPILALGKWDLMHWDWELATGTGKKVAYNGNEKDVLQRCPIESASHLKPLLSPLNA